MYVLCTGMSDAQALNGQLYGVHVYFASDFRANTKNLAYRYFFLEGIDAHNIYLKQMTGK